MNRTKLFNTNDLTGRCIAHAAVHCPDCINEYVTMCEAEIERLKATSIPVVSAGEGRKLKLALKAARIEGARAFEKWGRGICFTMPTVDDWLKEKK